jgi:hypothetical protein
MLRWAKGEYQSADSGAKPARLAYVLACFFVTIAIFAADPIPPTRFPQFPAANLGDGLAALEKQTGWKFDRGSLDAKTRLEPIPDDASFWQRLERIAFDANSHLVVGNRGELFAFAPGKAKTSPSLDGAFRTSARHVAAQADATTGQAAYTLALDLNWEPRFPVFRVSAQPKVVTALDNRGQKLTVPMTSVNSAVVGYSHRSDIRIEGLTRESRLISQIAGEFTVTAAPKMLAFVFDDLTVLPITKELDGVKATLTKIQKREEVWEFAILVEYPTAPKGFESFESWTNRNAARLISPDRAKSLAEDAYPDIVEKGKRLEVAHRFTRKAVDLANPKGWQLTYETPAPLVEFAVKFELKEIALP